MPRIGLAICSRKLNCKASYPDRPAGNWKRPSPRTGFAPGKAAVFVAPGPLTPWGELPLPFTLKPESRPF